MASISRTLQRSSLARSLTGVRAHRACNGGPNGPTMTRLHRTNLSIATTTQRAYHAHGTALAANDLRPKTTEGLQPKILNASPPAGDKQPDDVRKHNEEMAQRADHAAMSVSNEDTKKDKASQQPREGE